MKRFPLGLERNMLLLENSRVRLAVPQDQLGVEQFSDSIPELGGSSARRSSSDSGDSWDSKYLLRQKFLLSYLRTRRQSVCLSLRLHTVNEKLRPVEEWLQAEQHLPAGLPLQTERSGWGRTKVHTEQAVGSHPYKGRCLNSKVLKIPNQEKEGKKRKT